jgi:hypothetical protein
MREHVENLLCLISYYGAVSEQLGEARFFEDVVEISKLEQDLDSIYQDIKAMVIKET